MPGTCPVCGTKPARIIIAGESIALMAVARLIQRSAWHQVEPWPDDQWAITFKAGEGYAEALADLLVPAVENKTKTDEEGRTPDDAWYVAPDYPVAD